MRQEVRSCYNALVNEDHKQKESTACTSNDADFATEVMAWEDPFQ